MSSGPGNIIIRIGAETAGAIRGLNNVNSSLGDTMTAGQKATAGLRKAALPAAAALGAIAIAAVDATKAAIEDAAAASKLSGQLDRVTDASAAQIAATEDWITKTSMAVGVADDELRPALGKLATATGDLGQAQTDMALALDISAQTGKSLDTVTTALAKGYGGQTAAIGKLVPGIDKAVLATKDMHKITGELASLTGGAASESANTAAGRMRVWQIQMQEMKESIGAGLIPVFQALMDVIQPLTVFMAEHTSIVQIAVGAIAGLAAAILIANAAVKAYGVTTGIMTGLTATNTAAVEGNALATAVYAVKSGIARAATIAWTAVQWLLNAALSANPIGIVIIAVAALTAGIVLAYTRSETFRNIVTAAFNAVKEAGAALAGAFTAVWNAAADAFNWIKAHWQVALFAFGPIGAAIYALVTNFDKVKSAGETAFNAILAVIHAVESAIHSVISAVDSLLSAISRIKIPKLPDLNPFMAPQPVPAASRGRSSGSLATVGAGGTTINVYGALDPEGTARSIERILRNHTRRQGRPGTL